MRITIVDMSGAKDSKLTPSVGDAVRAVHRQVWEDFGALWNTQVRLRVVGAKTIKDLAALRSTVATGEGIVYVSRDHRLDNRGMPKVVAFHMEDARGLPAGFVFPDVAGPITGVPWSVALSHEILEMLIDPDLNLLVGGPHPTKRKHPVFRPYEVCDPVQSSTYRIDGIEVGNFVTPQYFKLMPRHPDGMEPTNFLDEPLRPFEMLPGGSFVFFDPVEGEWVSHTSKGNIAQKWARARRAIGIASRTWRRQRRALDGSQGGRWASLNGNGCANGGFEHWFEDT